MQPTVYIPSRLLHLMAPPAVRTAGATDSRPQPRGTSGESGAPLPTPAKGMAGVLVNDKA
ncbi:MAG: hypothetical protein ABI647_16410 [Gemmatimonadota bacterium]